MSTPNSTVSPRVDAPSGPVQTENASGADDLRIVHAMPAGTGDPRSAPPVGGGEPGTPSRPMGSDSPTMAASSGDESGASPTVGAPSTASAHRADTALSPKGSVAGAEVDARPAVWLPVAEAAERTSVSESALRKWIKAGELLTRDAPGPRGLRTEVTVEAVVARARQAGIDASPRAGLDLADAFTRLENLTGQLIAMSDRAARAEGERDHLKRRLDELKVEKTSSLDGERRRAENERSRGDALMSELSGTREMLTAERARADAMLSAVPRRKRHLFERPTSGIPGNHTMPAPEDSVPTR